jgi:hypothetical protein
MLERWRLFNRTGGDALGQGHAAAAGTPRWFAATSAARFWRSSRLAKLTTLMVASSYATRVDPLHARRYE